MTHGLNLGDTMETEEDYVVKHIVLTGGPCGGKTSALAYLKEQLTENRQTILFRLGYLRTTYLKATKYTRAFKENN